MGLEGEGCRLLHMYILYDGLCCIIVKDQNRQRDHFSRRLERALLGE